MDRRGFLTCCVLTEAVAGCLGGPGADDSEPTTDESGTDDSEATTDESSADNSETTTDEDGSETADEADSVVETSYWIYVSNPNDGVEEGESVCYFDELPTDAQAEFKDLIENANFDEEDRPGHKYNERPSLLDTDCINQYIRFEEQYYRLSASVSGG